MAEIKAIERGYNSQVVEILDELKETAARGDIAEIIVMFKAPDRTWKHRWSGTDNTIELVGAIEFMKARQIRRAEE